MVSERASRVESGSLFGRLSVNWLSRTHRRRRLQPTTKTDVFCGAGGSSAGARSAGIKIARGIDAWDLATLTIKDNFAKVGVEGSNPFARSKTFNCLASFECGPCDTQQAHS